jgi:hypothetical protein
MITKKTARSVRRGSVALAAVLCVGALSYFVSADDEPSLDDLLKIKPKPPTKQPGGKPESKQPGAAPQQPGDKPLQVDPELTRDLTAEQAADAFRQAVADMDKVGGRLRQDMDPGLQTQRIQESILARLDQVLAAARRQQQQSGSSGSSSKQQKQESGSQKNAQRDQQQASASPRSTQNSTDKGRPGSVKPHKLGGPLDETREEWGNLPLRLRQELIQGRDEKFSPPYRSLTEAYYRRLAEEGK